MLHFLCTLLILGHTYYEYWMYLYENVTELLMVFHSVRLSSLICRQCVLSTFVLAEYRENEDVC